MSETPVTLVKRCLMHGIVMDKEGALANRFQSAFPTAAFDAEAGEWRMEWNKGTYVDSYAKLEAFFTESGVKTAFVNEC